MKVLELNLDICTSFNINKTTIMGRFVQLDKTINDILSRHKYPADVEGVIAESVSLAVLLSSSLKYDGLFTLQFQSDGAVSMLVVDVTSDGKIRATARFDESKIEKIRNPNEKFKLTKDEMLEAPHWLGGGHMAFTVDQGKNTELYQGIVAIKGKNLSEVAMEYFKQSEQIETFINLFINRQKNGIWQSAGLILQKLPAKEATPEAWEEATVFAQSLKKEEVFDASLNSKTLLHRLYHNSDLKISGEKSFSFACRCSREKLIETLIGFKETELEEISVKGKISADCNFCGETYIFDNSELIKH